MYRRNLNFISHSKNLRLLQAGTLVAVISAVAMSSTLLFGGNGGTASIADTLASASFSQLPIPTGVAKPKAVSENPVIALGVSSGSDVISYMEQETGKSFLLTLATQRTSIQSNTPHSGVLSVNYFPRSQRVIIASQKPTGVEYSYVDLATQQSVSLGTNIKKVSISPDGNSIAFLKKNSDDATVVVVASPDGSNQISRLTTRTEELTLFWRTNKDLVLKSRRPDRAGYDLALLRENGSLSTILSNKENLETAWSPDGNYLLYSFFDTTDGVSLHLLALTSGTKVPLGVYTSAEKCSWSSYGLSITCGVPSKKSLTRDISSSRTATIDDVYTYDFDNNTLRLMYSGSSSTLLGVTKPLISSSGKYFVFINMFDSRLYSLPFQ